VFLNEVIKIKRRYTRSVNLERDLAIDDSVNGYILTPYLYSIVERFLNALTRPNSVRAWTLTGVYGTGKSACAHFLASLCGRSGENIRKKALDILMRHDKSCIRTVSQLPSAGFVKAVVTANREPVSTTLIRGLHRGASRYWKGQPGKKPGVLTKLASLNKKIDKGSLVDNKTVLHLIKEVSKESKTGLLIIIDELGKNLEFAAQYRSTSDLYLLQQIAELPSTKNEPTVFFIGLLHQAFSDYTQGLTSAQQNEWAKIQGRFEDIPLSESSERILYLIGSAIDHVKRNKFAPLVNKWAKQWKATIGRHEFLQNLTDAEIASIFPLHPLAAFALPVLCNKFSQNDRTLFTFLASEEPNSFTTFLKTHSISSKYLPTFKIHQLYDYFIESAGATAFVYQQNQRWIEIKDRISDARNMDDETIQVLKTIGILNLVSNGGALKASNTLVSLAMCDYADEYGKTDKWERMINRLIKKTFITPRKQVDELRIWEGSDFDIDKAVTGQVKQLRMPLSELLNEYYPLKPLIARRHSYQTGTLRFFERRFVDKIPKNIEVLHRDSDGVILYLTGSAKSKGNIINHTSGGRPVVIVCGTATKSLELACREYAAIRNVEKHSKQLQSDGVARSELRQRKHIAKNILDDVMLESFNFRDNDVWVLGKKESIMNEKDFNTRLSEVCDKTYKKGLFLWNELINRSELTSQGAKARRELFEAMLNKSGEALLGLNGYGPERAMFESLLNVTGIYSNEKGTWSFREPYKDSGVYDVWKAIELFCKDAVKTSRPIDQLFRQLESPPYGAKRGAVPILLLSVLQYHSNFVSVYFEGAYLPILTPAYFELLIKCPDKFSIKYFEISGLREKLFKELGNIISDSSSMGNRNIRNATLLGVVNPLVKFIKKLPPYTLKTDNISESAKNVRKAITEAKEPDDLLFAALPQALGLPLLDQSSSLNSGVIKQFRKKLIQALQELELAYERLLNSSEDLIFRAFAVRTGKVNLRDDLSLRARHLAGDVIEPVLKNFIKMASNTVYTERQWLEAVLMAIIDKPVRSWTDGDVINFESKLSDIARRFRNLEAIQDKLAERPNGEIKTRKVTIMLPDGNNVIDDVIWIEKNKQKLINEVTEKFIKETREYDETLRKAIATEIMEKLIVKQDTVAETVKSRKRKRHA